MTPWQLISGSPDMTLRLGEVLGSLLRPGMVLALAGDLGSGKTCLTQGLARGAGVPADEPVTSPTYTLVNHYHGRLDLYHFDFYRLESLEDLEDLGFDEYLSRQGVVICEWSQRFARLDQDIMQIELEWHGDRQRKITLSATGPGAQQLLDSARQQWLERGVT